MPIPARLQELLDARREVLEELDRQYAALVRTLALLEQNKQQYLDQARTIRTYIAEQLFGFGLRACPPITLDTVLGIPQALIWVFQVEHWRELAGGLRWIAVNMPLRTFGVLLLAALLLFSRSQMNSALENTGASAPTDLHGPLRPHRRGPAVDPASGDPDSAGGLLRRLGARPSAGSKRLDVGPDLRP